MRALTGFELRVVSGACIAVAVLLWHSAPVVAQGVPTPKERFNQGVALAKEKHYEEAIRVWLNVLDELDEEYVPKAHKALGLAYKKIGRRPEAWHHLTLYLRAGVKEDRKVGAWLEQVEKELSKTHRRVAISCEPEGIRLTLSPGMPTVADDPQSLRLRSGQAAIHNPQYPCPLTWWFVPGKGHVYGTKTGYLAKTAEIDVRERGEQGGHMIRLAAIAREPEKGLAGDAPELSEPTPPDAELANNGLLVTDKSTIRTPHSAFLEWVLIGSGAAVAVAGGIFHGVAHSKNDDLYGAYKHSADPSGAKKEYNAAYDDEVLPKEIAAYVLYGAGGAAVVAGVIVMAVKHARSDGEEDSSVSMTPVPLHRGAGAMMTFEF